MPVITHKFWHFFHNVVKFDQIVCVDKFVSVEPVVKFEKSFCHSHFIREVWFDDEKDCEQNFEAKANKEYVIPANACEDFAQECQKVVQNHNKLLLFFY